MMACCLNDDYVCRVSIVVWASTGLGERAVRLDRARAPITSPVKCNSSAYDALLQFATLARTCNVLQTKEAIASVLYMSHIFGSTTLAFRCMFYPGLLQFSQVVAERGEFAGDALDWAVVDIRHSLSVLLPISCVEADTIRFGGVA
jgi:hypothetical protein